MKIHKSLCSIQLSLAQNTCFLFLILRELQTYRLSIFFKIYLSVGQIAHRTPLDEIVHCRQMQSAAGLFRLWGLDSSSVSHFLDHNAIICYHFIAVNCKHGLLEISYIQRIIMSLHKHCRANDKHKQSFVPVAVIARNNVQKATEIKRKEKVHGSWFIIGCCRRREQFCKYNGSTAGRLALARFTCGSAKTSWRIIESSLSCSLTFKDKKTTETQQ